jgi:lycopene cyclase domain-containing protein
VTYTVLSSAGVLLAVLLDMLVLRTRLMRRRSFWVAYAIVLFFQLVMNGVLAGVRVTHYDPAAILGLRLVYAPIEDVLFGFALITATLSLWVRLTRGAPTRPPAGRGTPPTPGARARRTPGR